MGRPEGGPIPTRQPAQRQRAGTWGRYAVGGESMTDWPAVNDLAADLVRDPCLDDPNASAVCFIESHRATRRVISAHILASK